MVPIRLAAFAAALGCVLAGCGAERAQVPAPIGPPGAVLKQHRFPSAGLTVGVPFYIAVERNRPGPSLFRAAFADWYVAGFAYRRAEEIPRRRSQLAAARRRLVRQVRRRSRRFRVIRSRTTRVAGAPAVELVGDQPIARTRVRTRSVHVFKGRAEYVLELVAPLARYPRVNQVVFDRVLDSLRVTGRIERPRRRPSRER